MLPRSRLEVANNHPKLGGYYAFKREGSLQQNAPPEDGGTEAGDVNNSLMIALKALLFYLSFTFWLDLFEVRSLQFSGFLISLFF